jgi:hypothetical protein
VTVTVLGSAVRAPISRSSGGVPNAIVTGTILVTSGSRVTLTNSGVTDWTWYCGFTEVTRTRTR